MKFRAKVQPLALNYLAVAVINFICRLHAGKTLGLFSARCYGFGALIWLLVSLIVFVRQNFIYWELDSTSLRQLWFWKKTAIHWQEVTRIGLMNYKRPASSGLEIDYIHAGPMTERGTMLANPVGREQFIAALRQFAANATFDV
jgi:hypothetical protein